MDILIVKLGALGDVINTLPLAILLNEQLDARIHWLVEPLSHPLVAQHPGVHRAIRFNKKDWKASAKQVRQELKNQKFDIALDLQRLLKSGYFTLKAQASRKIGFDKKRCKEMTWLFPFERIPASDPESHMLLQYLEFGRYLGISAPEKIRWDIPVAENCGHALPDKYIVLNVGATKPANRWTAEGFASVADRVWETYQVKSVLTGGPEDSETADSILSLSGAKPVNLAGHTTLDELKTVLYRSEAVVTCDTGPMHLAVALGKQVIALFGPSNPRRTGPFIGDVIQKTGIECSPCNAKRCDNPLCMQAITPEDVMEKLAALL